MPGRIISVAFKIVEPLLSLLEQLGLKEPIKSRLSKAWTWVMSGLTIAAVSVYGAWLWLWAITPPWAVPFLLILLLVASLTTVIWIAWLLLRLIEQWHAAHSRLTLDTERYREIGKSVLQLAEEILSAQDEWDQDYPTNFHPHDLNENWNEHDKKRRANEFIMGRRFKKRFIARTLHALHNISLLGIRVPHHTSLLYIRDMSSDQISRLCNYLVLVGGLLEGDQLDDARKLTDHDLWRIS